MAVCEPHGLGRRHGSEEPEELEELDEPDEPDEPDQPDEPDEPDEPEDEERDLAGNLKPLPGDLRRDPDPFSPRAEHDMVVKKRIAGRDIGMNAPGIGYRDRIADGWDEADFSPWSAPERAPSDSSLPWCSRLAHL